MKYCEHTHWLNISHQGCNTYLALSDRLQNITKHIPNPDVQKPSLFLLIGNATKSVSLKEVFGLKARHIKPKRGLGDIHLHIAPFSVFHDRPLIVADSDAVSNNLSKKIATAKCHEITYRLIQRSSDSLNFDHHVNGIYGQLLLPFVDVLCLFADDLGGFKQVAQLLASWLERGQVATFPESVRPQVFIVTEKIPLGGENEAKRAFLWCVEEQTKKDIFEVVSAIDIIALLPRGSVSIDVRYRLLRERLMKASDHVRKSREEAHMLFSVTHFMAFLKAASDHFSHTDEKPFNFITASRTSNPTASDLEEHMSNFLKHIKSPRELIEFAAPMIASCILLDNYPPHSHRKSIS
jgi:hypothetical protein